MIYIYIVNNVTVFWFTSIVENNECGLLPFFEWSIMFYESYFVTVKIHFLNAFWK